MINTILTITITIAIINNYIHNSNNNNNNNNNTYFCMISTIIIICISLLALARSPSRPSRPPSRGRTRRPPGRPARSGPRAAPGGGRAPSPAARAGARRPSRAPWPGPGPCPAPSLTTRSAPRPTCCQRQRGLWPAMAPREAAGRRLLRPRRASRGGARPGRRNGGPWRPCEGEKGGGSSPIFACLSSISDGNLMNDKQTNAPVKV